MKHLERRVRRARPETVPEELDEAVRRMIRLVHRGRPGGSGIWISLRAALAAAAAAATFGILIGLALAPRNTAERPAETVVTVPMPPRVTAVLEGKDRAARRRPVLSRTWTNVSFHPTTEGSTGCVIRKEVTR